MDGMLYVEFNVLCVQVVINDGNLEEVEWLVKLVLDEFFFVWFYSCIVVIFVYGEVLYCKGDFS